MGAMSGGICHPSADAAARDFCTRLFPAVVANGDVVSCKSVTGATVETWGGGATANVFYCSSAGGCAERQQWVTLQYCDANQQTADLSEMFGLLAGAVAVVWLAKMVYANWFTLGGDHGH